MTNDRPDIAAAVARMNRTVSVGRELRELGTVIGAHEGVERIVRGTDGQGFGVLVLTERRLVFFRLGLTSRRVEDFALGSVSSVAWSARRGTGDLTVVAGGVRFVVQALGEREGAAFADALRVRTAAFVAPTPVPAPAPVAAGSPVQLARHPDLPTLFLAGVEGRNGHYLVCDPTVGIEQYRVHADGSIHRRHSPATVAGAVAIAVVAVAIVVALLGSLLARNIGVFGGWLLVGGVLGLVLRRRLGVQAVQILTAARPAPEGATVRVLPANTQAWRMCEIAVRLTGTQAWPRRQIDERRHVPELLWGAVRRSVQLDVEMADVLRAEKHESLRDIARQNRERIEAERAVLESVRENLAGVLEVAVRIDRRATDRAEAARAELEARELRGRLLGTHAGEPPFEQADSAAGLAAESTEIARLLEETDRLLS